WSRTLSACRTSWLQPASHPTNCGAARASRPCTSQPSSTSCRTNRRCWSLRHMPAARRSSYNRRWHSCRPDRCNEGGMEDGEIGRLRIGIDLGGTKIEGVALDSNGSVRARERIATPRNDYAATIVAIRDLVRLLRERGGAGH